MRVPDDEDGGGSLRRLRLVNLPPRGRKPASVLWIRRPRVSQDRPLLETRLFAGLAPDTAVREGHWLCVKVALNEDAARNPAIPSHFNM